MTERLSAHDVQALLDTLCVKLGFCLSPDGRERLQEHRPSSIDAFTEAVFTAEGLDIESADRHIVRQVKQEIARAFQ